MKQNNKHMKKQVIFFSLLYILLGLCETQAQTTIIPFGSSWKYYDQGNVGTLSWKTAIYDDSFWANGFAELGYGDGDEMTTVSYGGNPNNRYTTTYFRKTINLTYVSQVTCRIKVDDGCVVYINGNEIFRNNLPIGTISYSTFALNANNENAVYSFTIPESMLQLGSNIIAVEMHQNSLNSTDLSFDFDAVLSAPPPIIPPFGIYINEVLSSNSSITLPSHQSKDDYIEIWNYTDTAYNLSDHYISDDINEPLKYQLPNSTNLLLNSNGYLLLIASGSMANGPNHLPFKLSIDGETIILSKPDGTILDQILLNRQRTNISYGRNPNNYTQWKYMATVTPKSKNSLVNQYDEILDPPLFSHTAGFYSTSFNLSLSTPTAGATIYYTLDGSDPDPTNLSGRTFSYKTFYPEYSYENLGPAYSETYRSFLYNSPIPLSNKTNSPNKVSTKASTFGPSNYFPNSLVKKANVIRAIVTKPGALTSDILTNTYFINPNGNQNTFPIFSFTTNEKNLFDYTIGMYTPGYEYERNFPQNATVCSEGNYSLNFEREGSIEFFKQSNLVFNQNIKYEINGACTKSVARKSIRIESNSTFPSNLFSKYPEKESDNLILRNAGNLWNRVLFLDAYYQDLVSHLDISTQATTPSILYINGEYWGVHNLRERYDNNYLSNTYNVSKDSVDLLAIDVNYGPFVAKAGDYDEYNALINFISTSDLSNSYDYSALTQKVDISNYIDYQIAAIFSGVWDWPNNNMRIWRYKLPQSTSNKYKDGKWRFMLFDIDSGVGILNNYFDSTIETAKSNDINLRLFEKVLLNSTFKSQFVNRFCDLLNTAYLTSRTITSLNNWGNLYQPEFNEHSNRWNSPNATQFNDDFNKMYSFMSQRPAFIKNDLQSKLSLANKYTLDLSVQDTLHGFIKVNTINIHPSTPGVPQNYKNWNGEYFANVTITLRAKPKLGYKFKHWIYNNTNSIIYDSVLVITPVSSRSYTAVFEAKIISDNPYPIAKIIDNCGYKLTSFNESTSYPNNMAFVYFNETEPTINALVESYTTGRFDLTSRTRINSLGDDGISFINTSSSDPLNVNVGFPMNKLGGAVLALNTNNQDSVFVSWIGRTIQANNRIYKIRLQYRIGDILPFNDVLDKNGNPIEYTRNNTSGHFQLYEKIALPPDAINKPYIQLLWRYYYHSGTGSRPQLAIDDILISTKKIFNEYQLQTNMTINQFSTIESKATIIPNQLVEYTAEKSITLLPGFETQNFSIFKAQIGSCNENQ